MIQIPKAPKIRELKQLFLYHGHIGKDLYFSDDYMLLEKLRATPLGFDPEKYSNFTGVCVDKKFHRMLSYLDGYCDSIKDFPFFVQRDSIGYIRNLGTYADVYGKNMEVEYFFGKRNVLERIRYPRQKTGISKIEFSRYSDAKANPRVINMQFVHRGSYSLILTANVNDWLAKHGYKMGDILSMSPEDYNIMMFECMISSRL
jgi:hypothetical protein